jgi:hypothetical protein
MNVVPRLRRSATLNPPPSPSGLGWHLAPGPPGLVQICGLLSVLTRIVELVE